MLFSIITPVPARSPCALSALSDLNGAMAGTAATADLAVVRLQELHIGTQSDLGEEGLLRETAV